MKKSLKLAGCVITDNSGNFLLIHRNLPNLKQWEIPGGKIEPGETAEQAAVREIQEELGVKVRIHTLTGVQDFTYNNIVHNYAWFSASIVSGVPKILEPEYFDQVKYFSQNELVESYNNLSRNVKNYMIATGVYHE